MASVSMDPFTELSSSPGPMDSGPKKSWNEIRSAVHKSHRVASSLLGRMPSSFTFSSIDTPNGQKHRLYFLGVQNGQRDNTLLYTDIDPCCETPDESVDVNLLLESFRPTTVPYAQLSKEEQLLRERKRLRSFGIMAYDYHESSGRFVFAASNRLFTCDELIKDTGFSMEPLSPKELLTSCSSSKLDPKMCPSNPDLLAFVSCNDIWITDVNLSKDQRLTFAHTGAEKLVDDPKSAGVPSFVVQEEFDRYTGYWWQPGHHYNNRSRPLYRILYEEVDESEVQILNIISPDSNGITVDEYRYPRAGTHNAKSTLNLLEFEIDDHGAISKLCNLHLPQELSKLFPWMEYLLRAGWTPDGKYAYAVICDRRQQKLQMVLMTPSCFCLPTVSAPDDNAMTIDYESYIINNMHIVYEDTTDIWLHVHDVLHFMPQDSSQEISFIFASEKSGHLHLYHITSPLSNCPSIGNFKASFKETQLTDGEWEIDGKQVWVDETRQLVYFVGFKDSPLETHLYFTSLCRPCTVSRLTPPGYSHSVSVNKSCSMFVSVFSSLQEPPSCCVYRLSESADSNSIQAKHIQTLLENSDTEYTAPECFSYASHSGYIMYGLVYKPEDMVPDKKYPTVVFVYAGPQVQMVSNTYKGMRFLRLHTLASLGYVVVVLDSRGSCHRGIKFESHIHLCMGQVELDDQVEGLQWLARTGGYIDMSRVAIHGWSYGGYISLMGLCKRPDIFKIAIAGAPVTSWDLYDTGYTERYMGLPLQNPEGYRRGSIIKHVDKFPTEKNRLLIVHGLIDENVHFYHTSVLINALVKACKPYDLQVYPNERHGIRNPGANEHYEVMLLAYLQQHL